MRVQNEEFELQHRREELTGGEDDDLLSSHSLNKEREEVFEFNGDQKGVIYETLQKAARSLSYREWLQIHGKNLRFVEDQDVV